VSKPALHTGNPKKLRNPKNMSADSHLSVAPPLPGGRAPAPTDDMILSEIPDLPTTLSAREKKIWVHVTTALHEYGLVHRTDGLMLSIICRTYVDWVDANRELDEYKKANAGSYITESANGYRAPHPLYYVVRDHKKSLLDWLPEAALTIPSFQKLRVDSGEKQPDLFDDPIKNFKAQKAAIGMRVVGKE
jgi:P27 family predicted phage terminase small subunit